MTEATWLWGKPGWQHLNPHVWMKDHEFRFVGLVPLLTRMAVVRLADHSLWAWSAVPLTDREVKELNEWGQLKFVIAPNVFHHFFLGPMKQKYPKAIFYATPGLEKRRKDFKFDRIASIETPQDWQNEFELRILRGSRFYTECLILHKPSRTLFVVDMLFHQKECRHPWINLAWKAYGVLNKVTSSPICRRLVWNRAEARKLFQEILTWDFETLIMSHGEIVQNGGKEKLREALWWLKI